MTPRPDQHDDRKLELMLDRLGERERATPNASFEARIAAAAADAATQTAPRTLGGAAWFQRTWVRLAAAIAIVGGIGMATLMVRTGNVATNTQTIARAEELAVELDAWMTEMEAQSQLGLLADASEELELPAGWGDLDLDFWGDDDPVMGSSGWDLESF
ncbi:MAG: hypothetical protein KDA20_02840 [Phycisphaerales bacterium]|nr:hypothetical protein [Phycisphaerales bacterium]